MLGRGLKAYLATTITPRTMITTIIIVIELLYFWHGLVARRGWQSIVSTHHPG